MKALVRLEVVDVTAGACDQARVLAPSDGVTKNRAGHQGLHDEEGNVSQTLRQYLRRASSATESGRGSVVEFLT
jgi:hypothetical protein